MAKRIITKEMAEAMAQQLLAVNDVSEFFYLLGKQHERLVKIPKAKRWDVFSIPKKRGGHRTIENPCAELKDFHRSFNRQLQCLYALLQPECAFGFITAIEGMPTKNIYTNACQHLNKPYLINMDIKDFFTNTKSSEIVKLFKAAPFEYNDELANLLADLCTYNGHLATGAPTSPVLSNFVSLDMDSKISTYCRDMCIVYTRFVDDLTFSADEPITEDMLGYILDSIKAENQQLNPDKVCHYGPGDLKEVTGLVLRQKPDVSQEFLNDLRVAVDEVCEYKRMSEVIQLYSGIKKAAPPKPMANVLQAVEGGLNFLKHIRGTADEDYLLLKRNMQRAIQMNPYLLDGYYSLTF
jgi:RNA-directed DNA polymerase